MGFFEIPGDFEYEGLSGPMCFVNWESGTRLGHMTYNGGRRYIHNFWKLGGSTRIYDGNRAGVGGVGWGPLKNPRAERATYDLRWGNGLRPKGKWGLAKIPTGLVKYFAIRLRRRSAKSRHPV